MITLDKDFGELAVGRSQAHSGVVRLVGIAAHSQGSACVRVLRDFGEELAGGALLTVETGRIRIRTREA